MSAALLALVGLVAAPPARVLFDHATHFEKAPETKGACTACHTDTENANTARPGVRDHSGCAASGCHMKDFYEKSDASPAVCTVCHLEATPWADMRALRPFPRKDGSRDYCITFSHARHLELMGAGECQKCHVVKPELRSVEPITHGTCDDCHAEGLAPGSTMSDCHSCHRFDGTGGERPLCKPWRAGWEPVYFPHAKHRDDARRPGTPMTCGTCHRTVHRAAEVADIVLLEDAKKVMKGVCGDCHRKGAPTSFPDGRVAFSLTDCAKCHPGDDDPRNAPGAASPH